VNGIGHGESPVNRPDWPQGREMATGLREKGAADWSSPIVPKT